MSGQRIPREITEVRRVTPPPTGCEHFGWRGKTADLPIQLRPFRALFVFLLLVALAPKARALRVLSPESAAGVIEQWTAAFGPSAGDYLVSDVPLVVAMPYDACSPLWNTNVTQGAAVLVLRGECSFLKKASEVAVAGGRAMVLGNYDDVLIHMGPTAYDSYVPSVAIASSDVLRIFDLANSSNAMPPSFPIRVTVNDEGEYNPFAPSLSRNALYAFVLMMVSLMLSLLCAKVIMFFIRRRRANRGRNVALNIPLISYSDLTPQRADSEDTRTNANAEADADADAEEASSIGEYEPASSEKERLAASSGQSDAAAASPASSPPSTKSGLYVHNEMCSICLEDFQPTETIRVLPCRHGFHKECVDPWLLERSELCPMCKRSIVADTV